MVTKVLKAVGVALGVVLLLAAALVAILVFGGDRLAAGLVRHEASVWLGRSLRLTDLHIAWGDPIVIRARDIRLANAEWGKTPDLFAAQGLEVAIRPWPLLHGAVVLPRIALGEPALHLETSPQGEGNWHVFRAAAPRRRSQFPEIDEFLVGRGDLTYLNGKTGAKTDLSLAALRASMSDPKGPVDMTANGTFQQQLYRLALTVGPLSELRNPQLPYPIKLDGTLGDAKLSVEGTAAEPLAAEGLDLRIATSGDDLKGFLAAFGVPLAPTPPYSMSGRLTHSGEQWTIQDLDGRVGNSRLNGTTMVDIGKTVPYLRAQLTSPYLDIADLKGFIGEAPAQKSDSDRVIPDAPMTLGPLRGLNADLSFDGQDVQPVPGLPLRSFRLGLALRDGVLHVTPLGFALPAGTARADLTVDSTAQPSNTSADIQLSRIDIKKIYADMNVPPTVKEAAGMLGGYLKLSGAGETQRAWLAHADGDIGLFMQGGQFSRLLLRLASLDILRSLGLLAAGDAPIPIDCLVARFDVKDGVATASTLLLDTSTSVVQGSGNVNFADETLFLDLTPHSKQVSLTARTPIQIRGTLSHPTFQLNPAGIAARIGAAIGLGVLAPPAALLPFIEVGLGNDSTCRSAFAKQSGGAATGAPSR